MSSCPICLEPFFPTSPTDSNDAETALGAVDPCGHIFHFHCFALWKANQGSRSCKCPECNQPSKKCIKLFGIARPEGSGGGGCDDSIDEDNWSLCSNEDEPVRGDDIPTSDNNPLCNNDDEEDENSVQVLDVGARACGRGSPLEVIDMTNASPPQRPPRQQTPFNPASSADLKKYKRAAKKYRSLFKQKDSQCRELNQQRQSLIELHSLTKEENKQLLAEQEHRKEMSELRNAQLDAANLSVVRLTEDMKRIMGQVKELTRQRDDWNAKYDELQRSFKKEVQRVKTSDMAEVQQMMEERHKLLTDNERLVREHAAAVLKESKLRAIIRQAASFQVTSSSSSSTIDSTTNHLSRAMQSLSATVPDKKRKASSIAKELRNMEHARFPNLAPASREASTSIRPVATKMSARSSSLMEKVRQEQQKQSNAASTALEESQMLHSGVLSDGTNTRIVPESGSRRISLDSVSQQNAGLPQSKAPFLGLKVSRSNNPFFKKR